MTVRNARIPVGAREWVRRDEHDAVEVLEASFERHVYERHMHDTYAVGVTLVGVQRFWRRGATRDSTPGDVIAIAPGEVHDGQSGSAGGYRYRMLYVPIALMGAIVSDALERPASTTYAASPVIRDRVLARTLTAACEAMSSPQSTLASDVLLHESLVSLVSRHAPLRLPDRPVNTPALRTVRDYLHQHLDGAVGVGTLAAIASMSRFQLTRQFQRAFGLPLHAYQLHVRLEESKRRFKAGMTIADVAADLGFADQSHFHRRFKGAFGMTPGQWQSPHADPRR